MCGRKARGGEREAGWAGLGWDGLGLVGLDWAGLAGLTWLSGTITRLSYNLCEGLVS